MKEFKKKFLEMNLYGEVYKLDFPTMEQAEQISATDDKSNVDKMYDLLESLGLPVSAAKSMYPEDMEELVGLLIPSKKK